MPSIATIQEAPSYSLHRRNVAAADSVDITDSSRGLPAHGYQSVHVQVIPDGGDPSVEVLFWSEAAGKFISEHVPIVKAGKGVDVPYEFTVEARGRRVFVKVSTMAAGTVSVWLAAWNP